MPVMSKAERLSRDHIMRFLYEENMVESEFSTAIRERVPDAWHTLERDLDVVERKVKLTLYLDASVVKFYRAMGVGYQARISRILALWAHMKIGKALRVEEMMYDRIGKNAKAARGRKGK